MSPGLPRPPRAVTRGVGNGRTRLGWRIWRSGLGILGTDAGVMVRDEVLGSAGLWVAVIFWEQPLLVVVVLMGLLVVLTCNGDIYILLVLQDWPCGPQAEGRRP